jgi:hypothetical protein
MPSRRFFFAAGCTSIAVGFRAIGEIRDGCSTGGLPENVMDFVSTGGVSMSEKKKHASSDHHQNAASHHEAAAHHHRQAAHLHDHGSHDEAKKHASTAQEHSDIGHKHSKTACEHSQK